eukprot:14683794-Heterocapsa_arctica.AAC.1
MESGTSRNMRIVNNLRNIEGSSDSKKPEKPTNHERQHGGRLVKGRTARRLPTGWLSERADASTTEPTDWRRQKEENNFIMPDQDVVPTTDMETKIGVAELMNAEEARNCQPYKK